jgi:hypothetical protein
MAQAAYAVAANWTRRVTLSGTVARGVSANALRLYSLELRWAITQPPVVEPERQTPGEGVCRLRTGTRTLASCSSQNSAAKAVVLAAARGSTA